MRKAKCGVAYFVKKKWVANACAPVKCKTSLCNNAIFLLLIKSITRLNEHNRKNFFICPEFQKADISIKRKIKTRCVVKFQKRSAATQIKIFSHQPVLCKMSA